MPMPWNLLPGWLLASLLVASLLLGSTALAAEDAPQAAAQASERGDDDVGEVELDPSLARLLAELADDDYANRQRATVQLLDDDDLELAELTALYAQAETAEQRHRLLSVARHHTIRETRLRVFEDPGPVGSIGVYHREIEPGSVPGLDTAVVEIIRPMPGFPAYAHLQPGDLVLAVQGRPLAEQDAGGDFQDRIQQHRRGERMALTILRDGEELEVEFRLASRQALRSVYADAYDLRLRSPFAEEWESARDQLRHAGPPAEPLRLEPADDAE